MSQTIMAIHKMLVDERGGGCVKCGENDHERLQWVHKRGWQEFALNGMNLFRPLEQLEKEADKCDLVCVTCKKD